MNKIFKLGSLVLAGAMIVGGCNKQADKDKEDAMKTHAPSTAPTVGSVVEKAKEEGKKVEDRVMSTTMPTMSTTVPSMGGM